MFELFNKKSNFKLKPEIDKALGFIHEDVAALEDTDKFYSWPVWALDSAMQAFLVSEWFYSCFTAISCDLQHFKTSGLPIFSFHKICS